MDETLKREKIRRFMGDPAMRTAVHDVLLSAFTKRHETDDVHVLAAQRIAIDLLQDAWKDLERLKKSEEVQGETKIQSGL